MIVTSLFNKSMLISAGATNSRIDKGNSLLM